MRTYWVSPFFSASYGLKMALTALVVATLTINSAARELPPAGGPARDFDLPKIEQFTLNNGLKVSLVPFGRIPKVSIMVDVRTGNLNEGANTWLSDLSGELMKEGTELRSPELIAKQTARMGGQLFLATGVDLTSIGISVLSEHAQSAISLVAESIQRPAFPASELERLRASLIRNLSLSQSRPQSIASAAFYKLTYGDHPYGTTYPTEEQLNSYTLEQIKDYYTSNFGAKRSHIMVAGKYDRDAVVKKIKSAFGQWREGPDVLIQPPKVQDGFRLKLIDRPGAPQSTVIMGLPVPNRTHPDYTAFAQMQTLLGGYFSSRITANLREDKGYTYSPSSRVRSNYGQSLWTQTADITTEHTADALMEIFKEIRRIQREPPSEEEVERTQSYQTGTFVLSHATPRGLLSSISAIELYNLPKDYLNTYLSRINGVEPDKHQEMAQKHLLIDHMTIVIVGDLAKIEQQLAELPLINGIERID